MIEFQFQISKAGHGITSQCFIRILFKLLASSINRKSTAINKSTNENNLGKGFIVICYTQIRKTENNVAVPIIYLQ